MSYETNRDSISRTPITVCRLTMDYCGNVYGVAPCTAALAAGNECFNTYHTCQDKANYTTTTKVYEFSSSNAPILNADTTVPPRPYIKSTSYLPTEIKNDITIKGRTKITFADEPDTDIGIDPYYATRSSIQGTFWKKFIARNPNYKGRVFEIYDGFLGDQFSEFRQRWKGMLELCTMRKGQITFEGTDVLAGLNKIEVPPKYELSLLVALTDSATTISLVDTTDADLVGSTGYVRINDEVIEFTGHDLTQNTLTGCTRGVQGTIAAAHSIKTKVQICRYYPPTNPFDILSEMLTTDAGIAAGDINTTAFTYNKDWPGGETDFTALITEPTKLNDLYNEILNVLDCVSWVGEDLKITIGRRLSNDPARVYGIYTDDANFIHNSVSIDTNEESRRTRCFLLWDKALLGEDDENASYRLRNVAINAGAEEEYDDVIEEIIRTRWVKYAIVQDEIMDTFVTGTTGRRVFSRQHALPLVTFDLELKDHDLKTGQFIVIETSEFQDTFGNPISRRAMVTKRDTKNNLAAYTAQLLSEMNYAFIAPNTLTDFTSSTAAEREYSFITDNTTGTVDGFRSYSIY